MGYNLPEEPKKLLLHAILFFVVLFLLWLMTGGPERTENKYKPFLTPPAPLNTGERYGLEVVEPEQPTPAEE